MMPLIDDTSLIFKIDLSSIELQLIEAFNEHEPHPARAVERVIKNRIQDCILEQVAGNPVHISTSVKIHPIYNKENCTLAFLAEKGLTIWYLEIETKWKKTIEFQSIKMDVHGIPMIPVNYGSGILRTQSNYYKELKTQINIRSTITQLEVPPTLLRNVLDKTKSKQQYLIYNSSYSTPDKNHILPVYITNANNELRVCSCSIAAFEKCGGIPENAIVEDSICHFCQMKELGKEKLAEKYGTEYLENQLPFIAQVQLSNMVDHRTAIAETARLFETSKWKNEALLYALVKDLFPNNTILREYSPEFLDGLRIDIFIKEINLGIEYQGEQHYKPISIFGGETSYAKLVKRDKKKIDMCLQNGVDIKYFTYEEKISTDTVRKNLKKYIEEKTMA